MRCAVPALVRAAPDAGGRGRPGSGQGAAISMRLHHRPGLMANPGPEWGMPKRRAPHSPRLPGGRWGRRRLRPERTLLLHAVLVHFLHVVLLHAVLAHGVLFHALLAHVIHGGP